MINALTSLRFLFAMMVFGAHCYVIDDFFSRHFFKEGFVGISFFFVLSGVIIIPESVRKERMTENLNIFDFELDADDMAAIALLDEKHSFFINHHDGQMAKQFMEWRSLVELAK